MQALKPGIFLRLFDIKLVQMQLKLSVLAREIKSIVFCFFEDVDNLETFIRYQFKGFVILSQIVANAG